jgi:ankyrin repeat protein
MFESIGDILQIIVSRDWNTFRSALLSRPALFRHAASAVSACSRLNGMTLLHAVVRYDPPLEIVAQMIEICPHMPAATDCLGRTPLHVAAGSGCSASLVAIIARLYPAACHAQDDEGKTPLHFICDSSCVLFEEDHGCSPRQPPNHEAVVALLPYSLRATALEDNEGKSPLEHAIMSNASAKTVKLLGSISRKGIQLNGGLQSFVSATKRLQVHIIPNTSSCSPNPAKKIRRITCDEFCV